MPKITQEQKEKVLELYKKGYRSKAISKVLRINRSYCKRIVRSFDNGDFSWIESGFRHYENNFTEFAKQEMVKQILEERKPYAFYVKEFNLPETVLRQWTRNYNIYGVCTRKRGRPHKDDSYDTRAEEDQRIRRRDYLLQNVLPNLCGRRDRTSKKKILRAISECRGLGISLKDCLSRVNLSESTYHFWKKHENDIDEKELKLVETIKQVQESNYWAYGAKRMAKNLVSEGFCKQINHKKIERIMSSYNLHAKIRRRRYPKNYYLTLKENSELLPRNDLARNFNSDQPLKKLVTDITYLPTKEGWLYLAAIMDLYNHEIVSYKTSQHMSLNLVTSVVKQLSARTNLNGSMIHSDMGWTYTNRFYVDCLKDLGIHQSMSRKGNCWDNACIENFFGLFKSETIKQIPAKRLLSVDEMRNLVDDYIYWYNNQRIQKKLGYLSPANYRKLAT